jgi:hypothetical protein
MANRPKMVIVHCSDTPDYPVGDPKFDSIGVSQIDEWHKARGWSGVGYHWVIRRTGVIEPGRSETAIGAHCKGQNTNSLGVCLVGRGKFTPEQIESLLSLFIGIFDRWRIPLDSWRCHNEFDKNKTCPNVKIDVVREWLTNPLS